jgi:hypothetical protein
MKPVVSSIVALAIAIAPFTAMASPEKTVHKPAIAKVMKHSHHKKVEKTEEKVAKATKSEKSEKSDNSEDGESASIVRVRHTSKKEVLKPVLHHHAHNVQVGGAGHHEPKVEKNVSVVPAALVSKPAHGKLARVSHATKVDPKAAELPNLPNPNATKASKAGAEKGARKASEKKNEGTADSDGQPWRDEEIADLVARIIRGKRPSRSDVEPKVDVTDDKSDVKAKPAGAKVAACSKDPIEVIRGPEVDTFELTNCDGTIAPLAIEHLSVSVRPGSAARPTTTFAELAKKKGNELAKGIRRVDERLAMRLQALADHFGKPGSPIKLSVVSGYRPTSVGSMHATGRAIDFRLEGASNEDVIAFCKTLTDTGCGFYPNSSFVHLDVRDPAAGHVSWIDASSPGETPRYVSTWPPRVSHTSADRLETAAAKHAAPKLDSEEAEEAVDEHPAEAPQ